MAVVSYRHGMVIRFSLELDMFKCPATIKTTLNTKRVGNIGISTWMPGSIESFIYSIESHIIIVVHGGVMPSPVTEYFKTAMRRQIYSIIPSSIPHSVHMFYFAVKGFFEFTCSVATASR